MKDYVIALDAMGGDYGPEVTVPAALQALAAHPHLSLILVGNAELLDKVLALHSNDQPLDRIKIRNTTQEVAMDESPAQALRFKKDSSMRVAINLVKEGAAQACVSAGNTGALMATARFVLKTLPCIDRPAIITAFPTPDENKVVRMLDLGANVDCDPQHLYQFAVMASVLVAVLDQVQQPRIGLLNIGQEDIKGNELVRRTARLLAESKVLNYYGYVEGDEIFAGKVDVVVCDGFVGNVTLKTIEGLAKFISRFTKEEFYHDVYSRFAGLIATPVLKRLKERMDTGRRNGASFLGLQGIVIKSHGGANINAFAQAIRQAVIEVENNIPEKIAQLVSQSLQKNGE